jgi:hypothetical protein
VGNAAVATAPDDAQIASTGSSPIVNSRCGIVESSQPALIDKSARLEPVCRCRCDPRDEAE